MRYRLMALVLIVFAFAGPACAVGPWQPPFGSGQCVDCVKDPESGEVTCEMTDNPERMNWSGCEGGYICDYMPGGGYQCIPNCGQRCYYV